MSTVLLISLVNASNHRKCMSLNNKKCEIQNTLIFNLHRNEYSHELYYYASAVKLDRRVGSCNTLNGLSNKICVPNIAGVSNIHIFNMITGMHESKILIKHVSCKCKSDGRNYNQNQNWNNDKC